MNQMHLPLPVTGLPRGEDLRALAVEIHSANIAMGWWQTDPVTNRTMSRNVGELLALVHSEISEADEGYRLGVPDDKLPHRRAYEVELADVAIRVLDMLGFYQGQWENEDASFDQGIPGPKWADCTSLMHRTTTAALEGFRKRDPQKGCRALLDLLSILHHAAFRFECDLSGAIAEKRAFNARRADHKPEHRAAPGGKAF